MGFDHILENLRNVSELSKEPLLYEVGGIIFAFALMGFAHTMRRLLYVIGRRGIWVLPYLGAVLMLVVVALHCYANFELMQRVGMGEAGALLRVYQFRFVALLALLSSSAVTLAGAIILWFWMTGFRLGSEARKP